MIRVHTDSFCIILRKMLGIQKALNFPPNNTWTQITIDISNMHCKPSHPTPKKQNNTNPKKERFLAVVTCYKL